MSKILSVQRESNSKSILCLPSGAILGDLIWSPVWTVAYQCVQSRCIGCLLAALSAEVYIGAQSLHTSSGDFLLVGESGFEFGDAIFRLRGLLPHSMQDGGALGAEQYRGLCVAPYHHLAQKCIIGLGGCRVAGEYGPKVSFGSGGPGIGAAQVVPTFLALQSRHVYARLRWKLC